MQSRVVLVGHPKAPARGMPQEVMLTSRITPPLEESRIDVRTIAADAIAAPPNGEITQTRSANRIRVRVFQRLDRRIEEAVGCKLSFSFRESGKITEKVANPKRSA